MSAMGFARQHPLLYAFALIAVMRRGPQDMPASHFLLFLLLLANLVPGTLVFMVRHGFEVSALMAAVDLAISLVLVGTILVLAKRQARIPQTLNALLGVSLLFSIGTLGLFVLKMHFYLPSVLFVILLYTVFIWSMIVTGHIFSQSLVLRLPAGILLAAGYYFVSILLFDLLMPVQS